MASNKSIVYWEDIQEIAARTFWLIVMGFIIGCLGWMVYVKIYEGGYRDGFRKGENSGYDYARRMCRVESNKDAFIRFTYPN